MAQGSRLLDFGLPQPEQQSSVLQREQAHEAREYLVLSAKYHLDALMLSNEQLDIYYTILEFFYSPVSDRITTCFFIEGKTGCGKSFTARVLVNRLQSERHIVLFVGSTALNVAQYERG